MQKLKLTAPQHCRDCHSLGKGVFCELEAQGLDQLGQQKISNVYKKGQTLFVEGNPPYGMYCISKGNVKLTKLGPDGKESIVRLVSDGDVLGHRSVFTGEAYSATATALEETAVCFIDKGTIMKLLVENPSVATHLIGKIGRDLGASEERVASFSQRNVRQRVSELLLLLMQSHGRSLPEGTLIDLVLTREEMASMVGTATETLIRFVSELKEEGAISQQGKRVLIHQPQMLASFANRAL